jgi:alpha-1,6-mannosyltransferase
VVFPGFAKDRAELARALASADALVHGCPFETFGLSIAEAMSCGLPTVVPDAGGAFEMHTPESGETYAAGDPEACAQAMEIMINRLGREGPDMRSRAARRAAGLPTVTEQFEKQIAIYIDLLAGTSNVDRGL